MTDPNTNCGCNEGFPYRISARDLPDPSELTPDQIASIQEGATPTHLTVKWLAAQRIAEQHDLSIYAVLGAPRSIGTPNTPHWSVGDIICLPGSPPREYRIPCDQEFSELDITILTELLTLISYAESLGLAAAADPDTVQNPAMHLLLDTNPDFNAELAQSIETLTQEAEGIEAFEDELQILIGMEEVPARNVATYAGIGHISTPNQQYYRLREIDTEQLVALLERVIAHVEEQGIESEGLDTARERLGQHENATILDENLPENIEQMRAMLSSWNETADQGLLTALDSKIVQMRDHEVLVGVSVLHIINAFDDYHRHMQIRHNLLKDFAANLEAIDYLMMTPAERIELERKREIISRLDLIGLTIDAGQCSFDLPEEEFKICVAGLVDNAIQQALASGTPADQDFITNLLGIALAERDMTEEGNTTFYSPTGIDIVNTIAKPIDIDPEVIEAKRQAFVEALGWVYLALGFIPVVGLFVEAVDILSAILRRDPIALAINLFPEFAEGIIRRMGGLGQVTEWLKVVMNNLPEGLQTKLDELWESITKLLRQSASYSDEAVQRANQVGIAVESYTEEVWQISIGQNISPDEALSYNDVQRRFAGDDTRDVIGESNIRNYVGGTSRTQAPEGMRWTPSGFVVYETKNQWGSSVAGGHAQTKFQTIATLAANDPNINISRFELHLPEGIPIEDIRFRDDNYHVINGQLYWMEDPVTIEFRGNQMPIYVVQLPFVQQP